VEKMIKLSPESIHALHMAMQNELDTIQIYEHILNHITNNHARELLHRLIVEEHNHENRLKEKIISGGGEITNPDTGAEIELPDREQLLDLELGNFTASELIHLALQNEQISRDFYKIQYDRVNNPEVKEIFRWLVDQEETHIENLKKEYSPYLT
jgi:rubrerythrin